MAAIEVSASSAVQVNILGVSGGIANRIKIGGVAYPAKKYISGAWTQVPVRIPTGAGWDEGQTPDSGGISVSAEVVIT